MDVYVEISEDSHDKNLPEILMSTTELGVDRDGQDVINGGVKSDSRKDLEEGLVDIPFVEYDSDEDEETTEVRNKVRRYYQLKKTLTVGNDEQGAYVEGNTR